MYTDTQIVGSTVSLLFKKEGCKDGRGVFTRSEQFDVGACIGGVLVLVPFLWIMGYNPGHYYELECDSQSSLEEKNSAYLALLEATNQTKNVPSLCVYPKKT